MSFEMPSEMPLNTNSKSPISGLPDQGGPAPSTSLSIMPSIEVSGDGQPAEAVVTADQPRTRRKYCWRRLPFLGTKVSKKKKDMSYSRKILRKPVPHPPPPDVAPAQAPPPILPTPVEAPAPPSEVAEPLRKSKSSMQLPVLPQAVSPATPTANTTSFRVVSFHSASRPVSYHAANDGSDFNAAAKKRKSWLPGSRPGSRTSSQEFNSLDVAAAWVATGPNALDYSSSLNYLKNGSKVPELWTEDADVMIYLFPRAMGRGASFKMPSLVLSSSASLRGLICGKAEAYGGERNVAESTSNTTSPNPGTPPLVAKSPSISSSGSIRSGVDPVEEQHLFFPTSASITDPELSPEDVQSLVDIRNLFAFLTGQVLVATRACPTIFQILIAIASLLKTFDFTNADGSTHGEAATASFAYFVDTLDLADVRDSREKTLEALILAERMRSADLYKEAYTHAVGKYAVLKSNHSALFQQLSPITRNRLERSHYDLSQRQASADLRLTSFEFPSLFAGIAASTSLAESKYVRFKQWKSDFFSLRRQIISYYKDLYGQWPPKGSSKKNMFVEGGLNRLVLQGFYNDLCDLYDLLVDRESVTTRGMTASDDQDASAVDPTAAALRKLLAEFDRSSPPVLPPIPFDVPRVPTVATVDPKYASLGPKDRHRLDSRKLKPNELILILTKSHNIGAGLRSTSPFIQMYKAFEEKEASQKTGLDLIDMRYGHWVFLYATIQSLPLLTVDAPDLRYTDGAEYFLCQPSIGTLPWMEESVTVKREWYGVAQSGGVVSLPSDIINHGVEGVYRRSHCWITADKWLASSETSVPPPDHLTNRYSADSLPPLEPPARFSSAELAPRPASRARSSERQPPVSSHGLSAQPRENRSQSRHSQRNSVAFGLERLHIPTGFETLSPSTTPLSGFNFGSGSAGGSRRDSSIGTRNDDGDRRRSAHGGAAPNTGRSEMTFDDILQGWSPTPNTEASTSRDKKTKGKKN